MKRISMILLALVLVASMAACAPKEEAPVASSDPAAAGEAGEREMPLTTKLIMGTLKLEGTSNEVDAEQAAELVPLWKGYLAVSESESASRLELDGVAEQIAEAMTDAQMDAIDEMDLTMASMQEIMEQLDIEMGGGLTDEQRAAMEEARSSGQAAGGGMRPGGGGGGMGGMQPPGGGNVEGMSPDQMQTRMAERQAAGGGMGGAMGGTALVEALIKVLSAKL